MEKNAYYDDGLSSKELIQDIWLEKWAFLIMLLASIATSVVVALSLTPIYRAETILVPARNPADRELGASGSGGLLAGIVGANLSPSVSLSNKALALVESKGLLFEFFTEQNILQELYREKWDAANQEWLDDDPKSIPDKWDALKLFNDNILISSVDTRTGIIRLAVEWTDPKKAATWANLLVAMVNDRMRKEAIESTRRNIDYLYARIEETSNSDVRNNIASLISSEMERAMIARGQIEYAFEVLDKAQSPRRPSRPRKSLIVFAGGILGGFLGIFLVIFRRKRALAKV